MRGELIGVWSDTWREIWIELASVDEAPDDLYCELYRELTLALKIRPKPEELANIIDNPVQSMEAFQAIRADDIAGERALAKFFERAHEALEDLAGDALSNPYFNLLASFIDKFSLRYELRRPCMLCPTLSGVFTSLVQDFRNIARRDEHMQSLMNDFEHAISDLRTDCSDNRIKTCIQKQVNLLEAIGGACPGITQKELGGICNQVTTWPHAAIKASLKSLYGFTSDYPGIRHGGNPASAIRNIEMRDMIAMSILLAGFTPYLSDQFNAEVVYWGN